MRYRLLYLFRTELLNEAKRLVNKTYDKDDLMFCNSEKFEKELNDKYRNFNTSIHLLLIGLCVMKSENKDYINEKVDYEDLVEHYERYIPYKEKNDKISFKDISKKCANELVNNYEKYSNLSLYEFIPMMASKYMKCHNDSVDHEAIVMLLEEELSNLNKELENNDLKSLIED